MTPNTKTNNLKDLDSTILKKAYLDAVYWWVMLEHDYHKVFKSDRQGYEDNTRDFEKKFYEFTSKYSVGRSVVTKKVNDKPVEEGQDAKNRLLKHIFANIEIGNSSPEQIDHLNKSLREKNKREKQKDSSEGVSVLSLLSKFATLVNPSKFSMLDGNAKWSLRKLRFTSKVEISDYKEFNDGFEKYHKEFIKKLKSKDIKYYYGILEKIIEPKDEIIDEEVFKRRVADKYLWHYYDRHHSKKEQSV